MTSKSLLVMAAIAISICAFSGPASVDAAQSSEDLEGKIRSQDLSKSVPEQLNYQGFLADASDSAGVTASLEMTFRLFDSETKGAELWSETHSLVEVSNGLFQVLLGSIISFPVSLFDGNTLWLQTEVGAEVLSPRKPLVSTAYSQKSGNADHATTAEWATDAQHAIYADTADYGLSGGGWTVDGDNVYRMTGKVGIGTSSPLTELDVNGSINAATYYGDGSHLTGVSGTSDGDWTISGSDLYSAAAGNVGIGTTTPTEKLHVVGSSGNYSIIAGPTYGAYARNVVQDNFGYLGGTGYGVYGKNNTSENYGNLGSADYGVFGRNNGSGNEGYLGGNDYGAWGQHYGSSNFGYLGGSDAGTYGVNVNGHFGALGGSGHAVYGENANGNYGYLGGNLYSVYGESYTTNAAVASRNDGSGNYGYLAGDEYGIMGYASSIADIGVWGTSGTYAESELGGYWRPGGFFAGRNGVVGITKTAVGYAVLGWAKVDNSYAIYGRADGPNSWAGYFTAGDGNGVYISADASKTGLTVAGGSKNAVVPTDDGSRLLYCEESTEVWFSDYGFGQLDDGFAVVHIDLVFSQTVNLNEPYHVFIQPYGNAELYVTERTSDQFTVYLRDGDAEADFSYRIVAKRSGFEGTRLARAPWADNDPTLYPEKEFKQQNAE
jgi:hypothetical protein